MLLFALDASRDTGAALAIAMGSALAPHEERDFEDGEHKARPLVDPAGEDVVVIQSLHGGPSRSGDEKLVRLLSFIATLRDHGAARVTAVVPYLAYGRKDQRTKAFDPVSVRTIAQLFEAVGTDALITLEPHNAAAFENAFRVRAVHLDPGALFADVAGPFAGDGPLVVASPDVGGIKRVQTWREQLEARWQRPIGLAFVEKRRSAGVVTGGALAGSDVAGATVLLRDDLISTGGTLARAARSLREAGARRVLAFAAHGLFIDPAESVLTGAGFDRIVVTDSVPPFRLSRDAIGGKLDVVGTASLFSAAIRAHHGARPH